MKKLIITIVLALVGLGVFAIVQNRPGTGTTSPFPSTILQPTPSPEVTVPSDWLTFTSPSHGFSLSYPSDVTHETTLEGERFLKLGPTQSEGTELYDGISITIRSGSYTEESFDTFVQKKYSETKNEPVISQVSPLTETAIGGHEGYQFQVTGLGESLYIYLPKDDNGFLEIVNGTVEPANRPQTFRAIVDTMLGSLVLN